MSARTAASHSASLQRHAEVRRLLDPDAVRRRLQPHAAYAAYAVAYLDPALFHLAEFYEITAGEKFGLIMHSRGGLGPSTFVLGTETNLLAVLARLHPGPRQVVLTCETSQVDQLLKTHNLWRPQTMLRMQIDEETYAKPASPAATRRLIDADAKELNRLYALEDHGIRYSGQQISNGVYFGAFNRGRLVAAAGTHIYSPQEGVAVIGNVFTHPDFRGHGYGTAVTAAVTESFLPSAKLIVLNVDPANRPARQIYERLGFTERARLIEATATRRNFGSPIPAARRAIARWRAAAPGSELVEIE